jgi:hypothetical protein
MKITIWDILTIILLTGTVVILVLVIQIFSDPTGTMNPFPPPTLPAQLILPTRTNTPLRLPATWTPTGLLPATLTVEVPSGLRPTSTLIPTETKFVVDTWTPTATFTFTPTITRTPTTTRTPTNTSVPFAVTSVGMAVSDNGVFTGCSHTFTFLASIVVTGSGDVKYHWVLSDGSNGGIQTLTYSSGGTQSTSTSMTLNTTPGNTVNGSALIYIDEPNHQSFGKVGFALSCPAAPTAAPTAIPTTATVP